MKIESNPIKGVTTPRARDIKSEKSEKAGAGANTGASARSASSGRATVSDDVRITENSTRLQQLEARLVDIEITDPAKVEAVRQAIADGTFQVDEAAVAEGLVQESLEQLSHQPKQ